MGACLAGDVLEAAKCSRLADLGESLTTKLNEVQNLSLGDDYTKGEAEVKDLLKEAKMLLKRCRR